MSVWQVGVAVMVIFSGGFVQGAAGFGFGLVAVPLLMFSGIPLPMVLAISALCTAIQSASAAHHLREHVPWRPVAVATAFRAVSLLLGIWTLRQLVAQPPTAIRFWIGLVVLAFTAVQWTWQPAPRARLPAFWGWLAFFASGFTGGLCGMGGPPLVLWVMAHDWSRDRTKAFLFATFMAIVPLQVAVLYFTFGRSVLDGAALGIAFSPAVLLGSFCGLRLGRRFSKARLRQLAFALLGAIALHSMAPQILGLLRR